MTWETDGADPGLRPSHRRIPADVAHLAGHPKGHRAAPLQRKRSFAPGRQRGGIPILTNFATVSDATGRFFVRGQLQVLLSSDIDDKTDMADVAINDLAGSKGRGQREGIVGTNDSVVLG